jgi:transposase InsO family protein
MPFQSDPSPRMLLWGQKIAFAMLKCELNLEHAIRTRTETRAIVFEWIKVWYNRERRHSNLGFLSPMVFEAWHLTLF